MNKQLFALLALVLLLVGCPSGPVDVGVEASTFAPASSVDAAIDAAPHRLGSFNPTCTGSGVPVVSSGVQASACESPLSLAHGGTNAASGLTTANGVVTSSGTALQQAADVLAGSGFVSIGATPAGSGDLRLAKTAAVNFLNSGGAGVNTALSADSADDLFVGFGSGFSNHFTGVYIGGTTGTFLVTNTFTYLTLASATIQAALPIIGDSTQSSPYGVHGKVTDATTGSFAISAASYRYESILFTGGTAGTVTFPAPASDAVAYTKTLMNTSGVTKTISDGAGTTATLATGVIGRFLFDTAGVHYTGGSTTYP